MKKLYFVSALLIIASMILAACGGGAPATEEVVATEAPTEAVATEAPTEAAMVYTVGMVTDLGGIDDKSFNATAFAGVQQAIDELGVDGKFLESTQQSDYAKNIQQFVDEDTDLIVTVGFLLGVDTAVAAKANPDTFFTIVDYAYPDCFGDFTEGQTCGSASELPNVLGLVFATDQASFLAGYAAAASSKTGKVATWGGIPIPPVVDFMVGFESGVNYYNAQKGTAVEVLGWSTADNDGAFIGGFESADDGRAITESLVQEGADVILPVAGPAGLGAGAYCNDTSSCWIIGVDTDWTVSASEYNAVILTSVLKNMNVAVFEAAQAVVDGTFAGGVYSGTIANGGVGLAPVAGASDELNAELEAVKAGIADGSIPVR